MAANERRSEGKSSSLAARVAQLEAKNEELERKIGALLSFGDSVRLAFNKNHKAYTSALAHVDGHLSVMRAVINDVHLSLVINDEGEPLAQPQTLDDGNIAWQLYYDQYNAHIREENERVAAEQAAKGTLVSAEEADEIVFGGDVPPPAQEEIDDVQERPSGSEQVPAGGEESASADAAGG